MGTSAAPQLDQRQFCSECGRSFAPQDLAHFGVVAICADCKPNYVQRMREGATTASGIVYGGFWRRFVAIILDGLIIGVPMSVLLMVFLFPSFSRMSSSSPEPPNVGLVLLWEAAIFVISFTYFVYFNSQKGATPGKMALGLKIVTVSGERMSVARTIGRYFAHSLSGLILYIGYIMAAFDDQKRALHDHICSTRVIRT